MVSSISLQEQKGLKNYNIARTLFPLTNLAALTTAYFAIESLSIAIVLQCTLAALVITSVFSLTNLLLENRGATPPSKASGPMKFIRLSMGYHLNTVSGLLITNIDKIFIFSTGKHHDFGIYAIAFGTSRLIGMIQDSISTSIFSQHAGSTKAGDAARIAFRITFLPMLILAALGAAIAPIIIPFAFGDSFRQAAMPFGILLFECVIGSSSWILAQHMNSIGRPRLVFARQLISLTPVILLLPFIPQNNITLEISLLLLASSVIRLAVTLTIYPVSLSMPAPELIPNRNDMNLIAEQARKFLAQYNQRKKRE